MTMPEEMYGAAAYAAYMRDAYDIEYEIDLDAPRERWCLDCACTQYSVPGVACWQCGGENLTLAKPENWQRINGPKVFGAKGAFDPRELDEPEREEPEPCI